MIRTTSDDVGRMEHMANGIIAAPGGIWQCAQCHRRWAWATHTDDPCPDCGCPEGTELDVSADARRRRVLALLADAGDTVLISVADLRAMMEQAK